MKITIQQYDPDWITLFIELKQDIETALVDLNPAIEHIGSTSIPNLAAKPIIDILVGISDSGLDKSVERLVNNDYIYFKKYTPGMPYRRFFAKLKKTDPAIYPKVYSENDEVPTELHDHKIAHIHVLHYQSPHWTRHIAFRDYLRHHPDVALQYEQLKKQLSRMDWKDGTEYNAAKDPFIRMYEEKAIQWFKEKLN